MAKPTGFNQPKKVHIRPEQRRIVIPQSTFRPLRISKRDLVRREFLRPEEKWFVQHRRGIPRPLIGEDPLEARAVSEDKVPGFLHERIVYKKLTDRRLSPTSDFSFQSSFEGGRSVLGGIVVDFLFFTRRLVIRVQGPTHDENMQGQKDDQQESLLAEMGYTTLDLSLETIQDDNLLEAWMRRYIDNVLVHGLDHAGYGGIGHMETNDRARYDDAINAQEHAILIEIARRINDRLIMEAL